MSLFDTTTKDRFHIASKNLMSTIVGYTINISGNLLGVAEEICKICHLVSEAVMLFWAAALTKVKLSLKNVTSCKLSYFATTAASQRAPASARREEGACAMEACIMMLLVGTIHEMIFFPKPCILQVWPSWNLSVLPRGVRVNLRTCNKKIWRNSSTLRRHNIGPGGSYGSLRISMAGVLSYIHITTIRDCLFHEVHLMGEWDFPLKKSIIPSLPQTPKKRHFGMEA